MLDRIPYHIHKDTSTGRIRSLGQVLMGAWCLDLSCIAEVASVLVASVLVASVLVASVLVASVLVASVVVASARLASVVA